MSGGGHGPDVSREGVQRDILPIVEGTTVNTKHGMVKTDHILFIAAGAFHVSKPSDLIPELQGRFPIRVELEPLTRDDFVRILTEPRNALVKQYMALLGTEDVTLTFTPGAVERIADFAARVNDITENIGARRLHTVMERLLDELSFEAPDLGRPVDHDRRGLRRPHARRHRQERRSLALHSVDHSPISRCIRELAPRSSSRRRCAADRCRSPTRVDAASIPGESESLVGRAPASRRLTTSRAASAISSACWSSCPRIAILRGERQVPGDPHQHVTMPAAGGQKGELARRRARAGVRTRT